MKLCIPVAAPNGLASTIDESIENLENSMELKPERSQNYLWILGGFIIVLILLALRYAEYRIFRNRATWDSRIPPNDPYRLGNIPLGSVVHRRRELMRRPNLREPFVDVMKRLFIERGYIGSFDAKKKMPKVTSTSKRASLREMISVLWDEAVVNAGRPLMYTRWLDLEKMYTAVRSAAEADLWRFDNASDTAA